MITFVYFRDNSQSSTDTALSTEAGCTGVPTSASDNRNPSECSDSHEQNGKCNLGIFFSCQIAISLPNIELRLWDLSDIFRDHI